MIRRRSSLLRFVACEDVGGDSPDNAYRNIYSVILRLEHLIAPAYNMLRYAHSTSNGARTLYCQCRASNFGPYDDLPVFSMRSIEER